MPALGVLQACGWDVGLVLTSAPGDATRLAREAAEEGLDAVLAAGGDGTVNEIVQGLAGSDTSLGYLPYGTVNVWARELGLPTHPVTAAHAIVEGRMERVDIVLASFPMWRPVSRPSPDFAGRIWSSATTGSFDASRLSC